MMYLPVTKVKTGAAATQKCGGRAAHDEVRARQIGMLQIGCLWDTESVHKLCMQWDHRDEGSVYFCDCETQHEAGVEDDGRQGGGQSSEDAEAAGGGGEGLGGVEHAAYGRRGQRRGRAVFRGSGCFE